MTADIKPAPSVTRQELIDTFVRIRTLSEELCRPLETEDFVMQTMEDVSPPKWHIGHTTWFFERVILQQFEKNFKPIDERLYFVFNSYYEAFGERIQRDRRGTICRPTVAEVTAYRSEITARTVDLLHSADEKQFAEIAELALLGCNHEQQHQELFVTDIKHIFACSPYRPVYAERTGSKTGENLPLQFIDFAGGIVEIGHAGRNFAYDNESPRHKALVHPFKLANRPVSNAEFSAFISDNGYGDHRWWLSDAWDLIQREHWTAPLYWERDGSNWHAMTLSGVQPLDPHEPVTHVSFYEAAAYARWADKRLPTEFEWETAAAHHRDSDRGSLLNDRTFHPIARPVGSDRLHAMIGDVWEWTTSAYLPYPGYRQSRDALGEYNGKFMNNQRVLRGGSCATPSDHIRLTYRNFFQPEKRWQFSGFRLADDA